MKQLLVTLVFLIQAVILNAAELKTYEFTLDGITYEFKAEQLAGNYKPDLTVVGIDFSAIQKPTDIIPGVNFDIKSIVKIPTSVKFTMTDENGKEITHTGYLKHYAPKQTRLYPGCDCIIIENTYRDLTIKKLRYV